jgi:capsular polysaccharide biosynthesis protein
MKRALLIAGIVLLVLSAVLLTTGLVQFVIPPTFQSVAKISVQPQKNELPGNEHWVQTEMEKLQSKLVLYQVITNLDLNRKWGEKFKEGELPTDLAYKLLRQQVQIRTGRGTALFEIRARSDDPAEASALANGIAEAYRAQRISREKEMRAAGVESQDGEVQNVVSSLPRTSAVEIVDQAEPDLRPVKPHPLMKILVPLAGLLAGVLGVVLLMLGVMMKRSAKKSPPPLPT